MNQFNKYLDFYLGWFPLHFQIYLSPSAQTRTLPNMENSTQPPPVGLISQHLGAGSECCPDVQLDEQLALLVGSVRPCNAPSLLLSCGRISCPTLLGGGVAAQAKGSIYRQGQIRSAAGDACCAEASNYPRGYAGLASRMSCGFCGGTMRRWI